MEDGSERFENRGKKNPLGSYREQADGQESTPGAVVVGMRGKHCSEI